MGCAAVINQRRIAGTQEGTAVTLEGTGRLQVLLHIPLAPSGKGESRERSPEGKNPARGHCGRFGCWLFLNNRVHEQSGEPAGQHIPVPSWDPARRTPLQGAATAPPHAPKSPKPSQKVGMLGKSSPAAPRAPQARGATCHQRKVRGDSGHPVPPCRCQRHSQRRLHPSSLPPSLPAAGRR